METLFYNIFLFLFNAAARLIAPFNAKTKKWVQGRKDIFQKLEKALKGHDKVIWMHCASLGEFEQGRPLLERIRSQNPDSKILLTFFSPSGYEVRKDYDRADWVFYLPMDSQKNAKRFMKITRPELAIFVKYEFWYYYLQEIKKNNIPLLLVSGIFRKEMHFFKWYGNFSRSMLSCFTHFFVQDETSKQLLAAIGLTNTTITGDTRFDRVIEIAEKAAPISIIEQFIGDRKVIVAGSTWPEDEVILQKTWAAIDNTVLKLIIAPHEIHEKHIHSIKELFPGSIRFSEIQMPNASSYKASDILIIDNIGMLSRLYKYGYITYVGGGFNKSGIHNILEAAVYGKPVLFGPHFGKFKEAVDLIQNGGAFSVNNVNESIAVFQKLLDDKERYLESCKSSLKYVGANKGATEKVIQFIYKNRLLTN